MKNILGYEKRVIFGFFEKSLGHRKPHKKHIKFPFIRIRLVLHPMFGVGL